jgi:glycosyltransferase involved in cell wall biosynthesis
VTIALVERVWHGHIPVYYTAFCEFLSDLGHDFVAICPHPDRIASPRMIDSIRFAPPKLPVRPRRCQQWVDSFISNRWLRRTMRNWENTHDRKISLVVFACISDWDFVAFPRTANGFPWPWCGLYVHCRSFRLPGTAIPGAGTVPHPEKLYCHPNLHSVAVMDEAAVSYLSRLALGRPVSFFPDFIDGTPPETGEIAQAMLRFAAGRPIIVSPGHLQPSKGVATLGYAALDPANADFVFAFIGQLSGGFSPEEDAMIERLKTAPNVFMHLEPIGSDAHFNGVLQACDVVFAGYHDFPHSSNIMGKAAELKKPVIVSEGYLMAERARRYRSGEVVPQKDPASLTAAIHRILPDKEAWIRQHQPQWDLYRTETSRAAAKHAFARLINGDGEIASR